MTTQSISYPPQLPVSERRHEIAAAIEAHQVVIVAGETGSGKTTQLPKICLELGLAEHGVIGHTQPRRIAARSVAERIAHETGTELGALVGFTVRFTDVVSEQTAIRLMTDGILLAEIQRDPQLRKYSVVIVDEAHERSLNIDFLLGYLKRLLPRRPDLKVVITSATIDSERFAEHFGTPGHPAPVIEVSGRTYPVEIRYRPLASEGEGEDADRDQTSGVIDAVAELQAQGPGDVLVFLSGEREIRDTADALRDALTRTQIPGARATEIVPLYGRLSAAEQHRVFAPHEGRRVVLATNVAETSLTVPGIHYVVDAGMARISRYSVRTKVQRLPIEPISQASARQRAGRCGRVADGIAIRLYSQEDYESRPEYTDPEVLRTNLASVILQMANIGLGEVESFPFIDPPDSRAIRDGLMLLEELGAIKDTRTGASRRGSPRLTGVGRRIARLPLDPRLARMVLEADRRGCLHEVLVIVAAMSIQDPRERPTDAEAAADQLHARFRHSDSDFLAWVSLWEYLRREQQRLSSSAFRRLCRREHLHWLRIREWQDLHAQLRRVVKDLRFTMSRASSPELVHADEPATPGSIPAGSLRVGVDGDVVHQALLTGLLSHVGALDERAPASRSRTISGRDGARRRPSREYLGARGIRFQIFPGSALAKKPPEIVMAGELVETSRLWARSVAAVNAEWVESAAAHLVKRNHSEPHWSSSRGAAMARESVTLYGVPLVADRLVGLGQVDPALARDLFIRHALVEGDWRPSPKFHDFFHTNRRLIDDAEDLEHRTRRKDLVIDDDELFAFYDARIPENVVSATHFDTWWRRARRDDPDLLTLTDADLLAAHAGDIDSSAFPDSWSIGDIDLPVAYRFDPGHARDGVTVQVPAELMNRIPAGAFDWQVPGLRHDTVTALIRSLPKAQRRHLAPAPDNATRALAGLQPGTEEMLPALARALTELAGVPISAEDFDWDKVPAHLRVRVEVTGDRGRTLAAGKDVESLGRASAQTVQKAIEGVARKRGLARTDLRSMPEDGVPQTFSAAGRGGDGNGYPALVWRPDPTSQLPPAAQPLGAGQVDLVVLPSRAAQTRETPAGLRELVLRRLIDEQRPLPGKNLTRNLASADALVLSRAPHPSTDALMADVTRATLDAIVAENGGPVWDAAAFDSLVESAGTRLVARAGDTLTVVARILESTRAAEGAIKKATSMTLLTSLTDAQNHLASLVRTGFVTDAGVTRLPDVLRYVRGIERRVSVLAENPHRDAKAMYDHSVARDAYEAARAAADPDGEAAGSLEEIRWMLEELRINLFAQALGTPKPVSVQRITKAIAAATRKV